MLERIISGGQTGVDRGALDAALDAGFPCGGTCPRGRRAEDGPIDARYPLVEHASAAYPERTEENVLAADATLILARGTLSGGTALTRDLARRHRRPYRVVDLAATSDGQAIEAIAGWLRQSSVVVLNVAGPRESSSPGIGAHARRVVAGVIDAMRASTSPA